MSAALDLDFPFAGRWLVQNSPADRVPSHGTTRFASAHAIDFVPVTDDGRTAPVIFETWFRPESPDRFPGFGRPVLAPADAVVVEVVDGMPDHDAYRGVPSLGYALTQARRAAAGWEALAGNAVLLDVGGPVVALCHLRRGSIVVVRGETVRRGEPIAACGNSGNSTEPHVHVQAMTALDARAARSVPMTFRGSLPRTGDMVVV